jgi:hypothetical protein
VAYEALSQAVVSRRHILSRNSNSNICTGLQTACYERISARTIKSINMVNPEVPAAATAYPASGALTPA